MLKQLYELAKELLGLSQDIRRHEAQIKELQSEMKTVTAAVRDLTYEVRRLRDDEVHEREKIALGVENALLRFERKLIAGETVPGREAD
ncbi:MAG: GIL1 family protein [bacterium]|nr:GIL1 family protein [bacterium]